MSSTDTNVSRHRDHSGIWHSLFQPNSVGVDRWYSEKLLIEAPGDGTFKSVSVGDIDEKKFHWTATGTIVNDEFASGTWTTNKTDKKSAGTFILNIDKGGQISIGFLLGRSEKKDAVNYGAWVLAKKQEELEGAKELLADLSPGFKDFMYQGTDNQVSVKLRSLPDHVRLDESQQNLLRETIRCIESEAFRAAAVCGWSLAFDIIRRWMWEDADRKSRFLNQCVSNPPSTYEDLFDEGKEWSVLERMKNAGLLTNIYDKLTHYLRERNSYAHANDRRPTIHQVNHYLEDLVDIICARFKI